MRSPTELRNLAWNCLSLARHETRSAKAALVEMASRFELEAARLEARRIEDRVRA